MDESGNPTVNFSITKRRFLILEQIIHSLGLYNNAVFAPAGESSGEEPKDTAPAKGVVSPSHVLQMSKDDLINAFNESMDSQGGYRFLPVGFMGKQRGDITKKFDSYFGQNQWQIMHRLKDGRLLTQKEFLEQFYTQAYLDFFKNKTSWISKYKTSLTGANVLRRLLEYSDVFDTAESNVHSRTDFSIQETEDNHFHDIAIRRALEQLGLSFTVKEKSRGLLHARDDRSQARLLSDNETENPLHPARIISSFSDLIPDSQSPAKGWWTKIDPEGISVEVLYQATKVLVLKADLESVTSPINAAA